MPRPPFHVNVPLPPEAVSVALFPTQIVLAVPEIDGVGNEFIKTFIGVLPLSQPNTV